jgi:hypothetical protein
MIPKPEQASRWASQEAAIKAEITEAKNTLEVRMAHAIARLDALHAEMDNDSALAPPPIGVSIGASAPS